MTDPSKPIDADARFELVLEEYGAWLRKTVARLCPRDLGIQAEDVEQEVALRLWRALQGERKIDNLASYIYRIAATATIDAMRRVRTRRENQLTTREENDQESDSRARQPVDEAPSPERAASSSELLDRARHVLAGLPENRRRAVGLHLQGFRTQEIADLLGWTEPKARNLLYRGLKSMRQELRAAGLNYEAH